MKYFCCPNCDSRFPARPVECPSCGEPVAASAWKEIEMAVPPMPDNVAAVGLHGDLGHPFAFRKQVHPMGVGRPSLQSVSSQVRCCEREQFVLSWEGERCFISMPAVPPRNATHVDGRKLAGKVELQQGAVIDLRGQSGKIALPLTVLYT